MAAAGSSLVETASASCGMPLRDRISVFSERVSMLCLKTCALRWAMREPVLWVEYSTGGSKIRVMVLILPAA